MATPATNVVSTTHMGVETTFVARRAARIRALTSRR